ncbi:hypothetical protein PIB30_006416 [Stylosanthes scabra]|uniref:Uncharacterized protein n=1 Tax=Stylosanthes scabra TaxID=79078 RepID=A0ABU6T529_9FABA|nr:hypothetical protein [Stylosanthes scabra]
MGQNAFTWQPYGGIHLLVDLYAQQELISTVSPLLSFECVEWHSADRVSRQCFIESHIALHHTGNVP